MFFQEGQTSPDNQPPKAVRNEAYFTKTAPRTILVDVVVYFLCKSHAHFLNVPLSVIFICVRTEEHSLREKQCNVVLQESHIICVTLKSVDHYKQMNPPIVVFALTVL